MVTTKPMTIEEFEQMPDDGFRYEIVRGELRRMPGAGGRHGAIGMRLGSWLFIHAETHRLGTVYNADTGFLLFRDPDIMYMPDVAFVRAERLPPLDEQLGILQLPPDLVVEVVSPTDRLSDVLDKVSVYLAAGVPLIWVVDPQRRLITVHRPGYQAGTLGLEDHLDGEDIISGFRILIVDVFKG
jgi:Uma2 family endonuclease